MAIESMHRAARLGDPEAQCGLVLAALGERESAFDASHAIDQLMRAADAGFAPALRCLGMAAHSLGDIDASRSWFALAWNRGDALAASFLAEIASDEANQQALHTLALESGIARSARYLRERVPSARIVIPTVRPDAPDARCFDLSPQATHVHRTTPRLQTHDGVFSSLECEYVIALAIPSLAPSMVHDPRTGQPMRHPIRTSHSMAFPGHDGDLWLRQLQRRLAMLAGIPFRNAERLAVLRYGVGEEYRPHRDYLRGEALVELRPDRSGQRLSTAFCYLNDVDAGGETDFPLLKQRISPHRGRVVLFDNVLADGLPDPSTLHAGCPVQAGEKWLATLWFRERPFRDF